MCTITNQYGYSAYAQIAGVSGGTCTIAANQPGGVSGSSVYSAAPQVAQGFTIAGVAAATQTLSFVTESGYPSPPVLVAAGTLNGTAAQDGYLFAQATSTLAVTFRSLTPATCTIQYQGGWDGAGTYYAYLSGVAGGSCKIEADQAGGVSGTSVYGPATPVTTSFTVTGLAPTAQTITFGAAPTGIVAALTPEDTGYVNGYVTATATSGLQVIFTSLTPAVCYVSGTTVVGVSAGTCTIAADQPGGASGTAAYTPAPQVTQSFSVAAVATTTQSISFGAAPTGVVAGDTPGGFGAVDGYVSATATSGLGVNFTSLTPKVCVASGTQVTGIAAGTCTVAANQPGGVSGTAAYAAAPQVTQSFAVVGYTAGGTLTQTIAFGSAPTGVVAAATPEGNGYVNGTVSASATSGLAIAFTSTTPSVCTVLASDYASAVVEGVAAGTCTIAANQPGGVIGNVVYGAAPQATQSFAVTSKTGTAPSAQVITFAAAPTDIVAGTTPGGTGSVSDYVSATVPTGLPITFSSLTPATCEISSQYAYSAYAYIVGVSGGTCTIAANAPGGTSGGTVYGAAAQATLSFTVAGFTSAAQTLSFVAVSGYADPPVVVAGTSPGGDGSAAGYVFASSTSGLGIVFGSLTPGTCTIQYQGQWSGSTYYAYLEGVSGGTCTITADQAGGVAAGSVYAAAPQIKQNITIQGLAAATQTLSFTSSPSGIVAGTSTGGDGATYEYVYAAATSGLGVVFTSLTPAVCAINYQYAGGSTNYAYIEGVSAGTCTIAANQPGGVAGTTVYSTAAQVTQTITVTGLSAQAQTISFGAAPTGVVAGTTPQGDGSVSGTVSATAGSGLGITFSSLTPTICAIYYAYSTGAYVEGLSGGTCTIAANQDGGVTATSVYSPAPQVTQSFTVTGVVSKSQTIAFGSAPTGVIAGTSTGGDGSAEGLVSATATSGLAVSFASLTPGVCALAYYNGSTAAYVVGVSGGTCTIAADQQGGLAGGAIYGAAPQVTQSFTVAGLGAATQSITFGAAPAGVVAGTTLDGSGAVSGAITATSSSGLALTFSSLTPTVCSIYQPYGTGTTVWGVSAGTCKIAADQPGGVTAGIVYSAAPRVTQTFTVTGLSAATQTIAFGPAPTGVVAGSTAGGTGSVDGKVSATATSGLPVTFISTTPAVCAVTSIGIYGANTAQVEGLTDGTCTIAADQPGGTAGVDVYGPAPEATQSFTVTGTVEGGLIAQTDRVRGGAGGRRGVHAARDDRCRQRDADRQRDIGTRAHVRIADAGHLYRERQYRDWNCGGHLQGCRGPAGRPVGQRRLHPGAAGYAEHCCHCTGRRDADHRVRPGAGRRRRGADAGGFRRG